MIDSERTVRFAVPELTEDDIEAVTNVLRSGWITTGTECLYLEDELADYLDVDHVVSLSSCTAALETAVAYLHLLPGARVGVPTWTFASTALAAARQGFEPVLLDIDPDSYNLSPGTLAAELDEGLDAVIGVHFAGVALDRRVHELCDEAEVPLIEDAAHALGARDFRGRVNGAHTAGACYSFYATKNLTSGEGGALATDDPALADFARVFRLHGMSHDAWSRYHPERLGGYDVIEPGIKGNLSDILATLARSQLARFDQIQVRRRDIVDRYRRNVDQIEGLRCVPTPRDTDSADHLMVVELPEGLDRTALRADLSAAGVDTSVHFHPLHHLRWFTKNATVARGGLPVAENVAPRALSLPLHSGILDEDVDYVCTVLSDLVASHRRT